MKLDSWEYGLVIHTQSKKVKRTYGEYTLKTTEHGNVILVIDPDNYDHDKIIPWENVEELRVEK